MLERILVIILTNLIFYFKTLRFKTVSDDNLRVFKDIFEKVSFSGIIRSIGGNVIVGEMDKDPKIPDWKRLEGINVEVEHFISLCCHTLVCVMIYLALGSTTASFMAAMLFSVNPITHHGGVWISGRGYALTALIFLMYLLHGTPFYFLSIFTSSSGLLMPFVFLFTPRWTDIAYFLPFALIFLAFYKEALESRKGFTVKAHQTYSWKSVPVTIKTYAYYFWHILFPVRLGMYHTFLSAYGMTDRDTDYWRKMSPIFWSGIAILGLQIYGLFNYQPWVFGLMIYSVFIIMWCNIKMVNQEIAERYEYLPAIGLMYAVGSLISTEAFLVLFTFYSVRGWMELERLRNEQNWYSMNVYPSNFSDNASAWLIKAQWQKGVLKRPFVALDTYYEGLKVRPHDMRLNILSAVTLAQFSFYEEADEHLRVAEENLSNSYDIEQGLTTAIAPLRKVIDERKVAQKNGLVADVMLAKKDAG
jgi:hypothetical protein